MVYRFVSKDGLVQRIGDIDCESLEAKLKIWLDEGAVLATAEEHDQQVIGAVNEQLEVALAKIAELEAEKLPKSDAPAE